MSARPESLGVWSPRVAKRDEEGEEGTEETTVREPSRLGAHVAAAGESDEEEEEQQGEQEEEEEEEEEKVREAEAEEDSAMPDTVDVAVAVAEEATEEVQVNVAPVAQEEEEEEAVVEPASATVVPTPTSPSPPPTRVAGTPLGSSPSRSLSLTPEETKAKIKELKIAKMKVVGELGKLKVRAKKAGKSNGMVSPDEFARLESRLAAIDVQLFALEGHDMASGEIVVSGVKTKAGSDGRKLSLHADRESQVAQAELDAEEDAKRTKMGKIRKSFSRVLGGGSRTKRAKKARGEVASARPAKGTGGETSVSPKRLDRASTPGKLEAIGETGPTDDELGLDFSDLVPEGEPTPRAHATSTGEDTTELDESVLAAIADTSATLLPSSGYTDPLSGEELGARRWFFGAISRATADAYLLDSADNCYLGRLGKDGYVVSRRRLGRTEHIAGTVERDEGGRVVRMMSGGVEYPSVDALDRHAAAQLGPSALPLDAVAIGTEDAQLEGWRSRFLRPWYIDASADDLARYAFFFGRLSRSAADALLDADGRRHNRPAFLLRCGPGSPGATFVLSHSTGDPSHTHLSFSLSADGRYLSAGQSFVSIRSALLSLQEVYFGALEPLTITEVERERERERE